MEVISEGDKVADMNELAREMDTLAANYSKEVVLYAMGAMIGTQARSLDEVVDWLKMISIQAFGVRRDLDNAGDFN